MTNDCSKYCDSTTMVTDGSSLSSAIVSSEIATKNVLCTHCTSGCSLEASLISGGKLKKRKYKKSKKNQKTRKSKKNRKTKKNRKSKRKYKNNK